MITQYLGESNKVKIMKLIKVRCHTNLDEGRQEQWPTHIYNPKIGDFVRAKSGKRMRIIGITHLYNDTSLGLSKTNYMVSDTMLEIELNN